jgi:hypothetical protein
MHRTVSLQGASSGMFGSRATPDLAVDDPLKNPLIIIVIHKKECPKIGGCFSYVQIHSGAEFEMFNDHMTTS